MSCDPGAAVSGFSLLSPVYRFEPAGLTFARPVTVTLPFAAAQGIAPLLFWSRRDGSGYDMVASRVQGAFVVGAVSHFSTAFVGAATPEPPEGGVDAPSDAGTDVPGEAMPDGPAVLCPVPADPPTNGVPCGAVTCSGAQSACCHEWDDAGIAGCVSPSTVACSPPPSPAGSVERCDGPEDCPTGQSCCALPGSYCSATCPPALAVCHSDADCPPDAPLCGKFEF
jgi:hypothetical protein